MQTKKCSLLCLEQVYMTSTKGSVYKTTSLPDLESLARNYSEAISENACFGLTAELRTNWSRQYESRSGQNRNLLIFLPIQRQTKERKKTILTR